MTVNVNPVVRYPGGKQRLAEFILDYIPLSIINSSRYIEPFVGGAALFLRLNPKKALLSDINPELIDLYRGLRKDPVKVWNLYKSYPSTKRAYYKIRDIEEPSNIIEKAARTLFLNRTCFKGMWRHNSSGKFNIGYGGQDRRWVISKESLIAVSKRLKKVELRNTDFEQIIDDCGNNDFLFLDHPYKPGYKEMVNDHYSYSKFGFKDCKRLVNSLKKASRRGVKWLLTTTSHKDNLGLYKGFKVTKFPRGTGNRPGLLTSTTGEVLIYNYSVGTTGCAKHI